MQRVAHNLRNRRIQIAAAQHETAETVDCVGVIAIGIVAIAIIAAVFVIIPCQECDGNLVDTRDAAGDDGWWREFECVEIRHSESLPSNATVDKECAPNNNGDV